MAKSKDTEPEQGPEATRAKGAASLEEAMAESDRLNREAGEQAMAESGAAKAEAEAEANAAIAEAAAAQEARDDEVYGRTPAEPDAKA